MKRFPLYLLIFSILFSFKIYAQRAESKKFPYTSSGLTERQAAEHLLSRFTFGVTEKNINDALTLGLEEWFSIQLSGNIPDQELDTRLKEYPAVHMTNAEIVEKYSLAAKLRKMAIEEGLLDKNDVGDDDKTKLRQAYKELALKYGIQGAKELERQTVHQKILRALYSKNQLHEVLTDFWFNHFNVFMGKNQSSRFVLAYERDAIRPFVAGNFEDMLFATAQSPAMLTYLDNFLSMSEDGQTFFNKNNEKRPRGLNENYAREIMELHTLGVDGGYTQTDVRNAAKILTGWTIYPMGDEKNNKLAKLLNNIGDDRLEARGFVRNGDFLFVPNRHEDGTKIVMGVKYDQGGFEEGKALLHFLAQHPSTAKFICKKLATRFSNDQPDEALIKTMTDTYLASKGDIKAVLLSMVSHETFWKKNVIHQKIKSPFEYAVSALRALEADIENPESLSKWITKMGQKLYFYQAPTGFPDQGKFWINTGSLLNRMNFGLDLAHGKINGIKYSPENLLNNREPESASDALTKYADHLFPERDSKSTVNRLTPLIHDKDISDQIRKAVSDKTIDTETEDDIMDEKKHTNFNTNPQLTHVLGMLIGSPEFQRK